MSNPFRDWTPAQVEAYNNRPKFGTPAYFDALAKEELKFQAELAKPKGRPLVDVLVDKKIELAKAIPNRVSTDEQGLNKLERRFLARLRTLGYPYIGVQNLALKLANDTRYHPDFLVVDENGYLVCYETKGFLRDDSYVKIKVAARQFPFMRFVLVYWKNQQWEEKEVKP